MAKKTWIVWALFLLLPGGVGLCVHFVLKDSLAKKIAESTHQSAQNTAAQEYLQMYEEWSHLSAEDKADNPWGFGDYGGAEIQKRLQEGQYNRLVADLPKLDKGLVHYPDKLADVMYGSGWQQEVENYRAERTVPEIILIGSIFILAGGGLILTGGIVKLLVMFVIQKRREGEDENDEDEATEVNSETPLTTEEPPQTFSFSKDSLQNVRAVLEDSRQVLETIESESKGETESKISSEDADNEGYFQFAKKAAQHKRTPSEDTNSTDLPMKPISSKSGIPTESQKDSYFGWAIDAEDSTEFETLMTTEPLTKELSELTEEVSAIRHFAAQQQDQMRKLQDGYDWMIIRRFCLRVIRCIDNIEDRVENLESETNELSPYLEDIRDELVYALESSGIEQFKPDLNISFKGLEKYAEAVRERIFTEDTSLVGCIAEVARPGYQYLVNDDDVKIVRCAQVKLYEAHSNE